MSSTAIIWLRRDLRTADNPALNAALVKADRIVPVYIHAPEEEAPWQPGAASRWWLHQSLDSLARSLRDLGSRLVIRRGDSEAVLDRLVRETGADKVYWNRLYDPAVVARDGRIEDHLRGLGVSVVSCNGSLLREPWEVSRGDGGMYRVYTPFSRFYFRSGPEATAVEAPDSLPPLLDTIDSEPLDELGLLPRNAWYRAFEKYWQPGEAGAMIRLNDFIDRGSLVEYPAGRDLPGRDGVSGLSPHLHYGEISPRQIWHAVSHAASEAEDRGEAGAREKSLAFQRQLIWRDFAHHVLFHLPHTANQPFDDRFRDFPWEDNPELLDAWCQGNTGIPLVDAGMRQLWHTGWMHNRLRMLVASVLTKNGLVHWLEGAKWFWDTLLDADLANNSMGWQWTAGCGVDAAPYFRIFSPARQGERFDPTGDFVRTWVPELARVPAKYIHQPWLAPPSVLKQAGVFPGDNYPKPALDLAESRQEALRRFKAMR